MKSLKNKQFERVMEMKSLASTDRSNWVHYTALFFFLVLQYLLFRNYVQQKIAWAYPAYWDQSGYLSQSYQLYEQIKSIGFLSALKSFFISDLPAGGFLSLLESVIFYGIFGPSRISALTINFLHFAALQITLFCVFKKITKSWILAWLGISLVLGLRSPFSGAGGLFDFRFDFPALCLFGIYLCIVLLSKVFGSLKYSLLSAIAGAVLIFTRTISSVYLFGILGLFLGILVFLRIRNKTDQETYKPRTKNLCITIAAMFFLVLPFLWTARTTLYHYYVVGHLTGTENEIRAEEAGAVTLKEKLFFYPNSLYQHHLNKTLLFYMIGAIAIIIASKKITLACPGESFGNVRGWSSDPALAPFLALSFLCPLIILTLDVSKSIVVGSILTIPIILGFTIYCDYQFKKSRMRYLKAPILIMFLFCGLYRQIKGYQSEGPFDHRGAEVEQIEKMYVDLSSYFSASGSPTPVLSVNQISEYLNNTVFSAIAYEKRQVNLKVAGLLGHAIFPVTEQQILQQISSSNVIILKDPSAKNQKFVYPFDESMKRHKDIVESELKRGFSSFNQYPLKDGLLTVYVRSSS